MLLCARHLLNAVDTKIIILEDMKKKRFIKGKIYPFECRVPRNSKERQESLPQSSMQRNRGKQ